jgi:hypothetical protein
VVGALFWRSRGQRRRHKRFGLDLTDDLEVAAHLALHLAKQRSHGRVSALHLAWALLQDEAAAALLARLEFDITALEAALDQRLDGIPPSRTARLSSNLTLEAEASLRSAAETAPGEQDRSARANRCDCAPRWPICSADRRLTAPSKRTSASSSQPSTERRSTRMRWSTRSHMASSSVRWRPPQPPTAPSASAW